MAFLTGGNQGRPKYQHMGTSGVKKGSPPKPKGWMGALQQAKKKPPVVQKRPVAPRQSTPKPVAPRVPKPPANIFASGAWKSPAYNLEVLNLNQNVGQQQRDLQRQLADMRVYHQQGQERVQQDYKDDFYRANASLAGRGIYQSGMRENTDATRQRVLDQTLGDLTQQFGAGAQGRVNTDLRALGSFLSGSLNNLGIDYREKYAEEQKGVMAQKQAAAPKPKPGSGGGSKNPWVKKGGTIFYKGKNGLVEAPKQKHAAKMFKKQQAKQKNKGKGHKH